MENPYIITLVLNNKEERNNSLREEMIRMVSHAYVNPEKVVDRRFLSADKIFTMRKNGELHGFCTYSFLELQVENEIQKTVYLGIMAASRQVQNKGLILKAMSAMIADIREEEKRNKVPYIIWATTASPSSYAIFRKYFCKVSPDPSLWIRPEHVPAEWAMRNYLSQGKKDENHIPLVIKRLLPQSVYTVQETMRNRNLLNNKKDSIFTNLEIDETQGDRLLLIGQLCPT